MSLSLLSTYATSDDDEDPSPSPSPSLPSNPNPKPGLSSFFSSLPLPQPQIQSLFQYIPKPKPNAEEAQDKKPNKKIVKFVPPKFNMNLAEDDDDDDEEEEDKGKGQPSLGGGGFGGGSFFDSLPKPKSSLGGFGGGLGGGGSGRRSVLEAEGMSGVGYFKSRKESRVLNSESGDALAFGGIDNGGGGQWSNVVDSVKPENESLKTRSGSFFENLPKPGGGKRSMVEADVAHGVESIDSPGAGGGKTVVEHTAAGLSGNEAKKSEFSAKVDDLYQSSDNSSNGYGNSSCVCFGYDNNESLAVKDEVIEGSESYGSYMHYENYPSYDSNYNVGYDQPAESYGHYEHYPSYESGGGANIGHDQSVVVEGNVGYGNYEGGGGGYGGSIGGMTDPMMSMMGKKRKKDVIPDDIVEVKQDELMKNRPKEDNAKLTGIAFGPCYQPAPSAKGKPSKLHKRKHQIGSLYYDMRSKEAELADRRAKGFLTKAETHAKYGW